MLRNNKKFFSISILMIIISIIGIICWSNKNNQETDLFNKKIIYNFGFGTSYEIDIPQIKNYYEQIVIRNNALILLSSKDDIIISKNETIFEDLPPNEMLAAGSMQSYKIIYEDETNKLYEVTNIFSYNSPSGAKSENSVSYELYRKENDYTLQITGSDKDKILEISSLIKTTNQSRTLEEQFYGITVLDERIIDTSKITINEIYNVDAFLDVGIKLDESLINVCFLSKKDTLYLPELKMIDNWKLINEKANYKVYHGSSSGIQSDSLKIIKDNKEYFIDLSIPEDLYRNERKINSDGSTTIYMYLTQETIEMIVNEIFNILK